MFRSLLALARQARSSGAGWYIQMYNNKIISRPFASRAEAYAALPYFLPASRVRFIRRYPRHYIGFCFGHGHSAYANVSPFAAEHDGQIIGDDGMWSAMFFHVAE
jgi:hypothetical protein